MCIHMYIYIYIHTYIHIYVFFKRAAMFFYLKKEKKNTIPFKNMHDYGKGDAYFFI